MTRASCFFPSLTILAGLLLDTGCVPLLHSREYRTVLTVAPSADLRDQIRSGVVTMKELRKRGDALTLTMCARRSQPGYSVRQMSQEAHDFVLHFGAMSATCDISFQWPGPAILTGETEVSGTFHLASVRAVSIPEESSWVAQAAWHAVPRKGQFKFRLPATTTSDLPVSGIDDLVTQHVESLLSKRIEPELDRLLRMKGPQRFLERKAAFGTGDCAAEACPHEDGIDCLAILQLAQRIRDPDSPPPYLPAIPAADREELVTLANEICRLMLPKQWTSVLKEKRKGRPAFLSKTSVILAGAEQVEMTRNAFAVGNEVSLLRLEKKMVELVTKLNQANVKLAAAGEPAETQDQTDGTEDHETTCEECGHKGRFHYDEEGNGFCPKCNAPEVITLPEPLTIDLRSQPTKAGRASFASYE